MRWNTHERQILTRRQMEFLSMIGNGMKPAEIAEELTISRRTVEWTLRSAKERLEANNLPQMIVKAIALELLILDHDGTLRTPQNEEFVMVPLLQAA